MAGKVLDVLGCYADIIWNPDFQGLYNFFPPFPNTGKNSFPKTSVFPTLGKGSKQARSFLLHMFSWPPSVHPSVHHQSDGHVGHNNRVPFRYNQVCSGHSAITALQLIKFQVNSAASQEGAGRRFQTQKPLPCASK
jgi:hypothetical protein